MNSHGRWPPQADEPVGNAPPPREMSPGEGRLNREHVRFNRPCRGSVLFGVPGSTGCGLGIASTSTRG
jgi:hypothetical protein